MTTSKNESDRLFYRAIMESSVDPIVIIDAQGNIQDTNKATSQIFGFETDELIGKKVNILMSNQDAEAHDGYIERFLETREAKVINTGRFVKGKTKLGEPIQFRLSVSEIKIGEQTYFTGILSDVTEILKKQEIIEKQAELLASLNQWSYQNNLRAHEKIITFLDLISSSLQTRYITFIPNRNASHAKLLWPAYINSNNEEPSITESLLTSELGHIPERSTFHRGEELAALSKGLPHSLMQIDCYPIFHSNQWLGNINLFWTNTRFLEFKHYRETIDTCFSQFGAYLELYITLRNLEIANDRFSRSQNYANIGTWDWDIESGELFWTERIAPLFGYAKGELKTSYENFINAVHPQDRQLVETAINRCLEENATYDIDHRVVWPDGSVHWVNERGNVQRDPKGTPLKMLGVIRDIQREKIAEENMKSAFVEVEKASRSKSEFLSLMSHELRTPLNSVLGFAQLLETENLTANQSLYTTQILQGGKLLLQLVNDVLDLAKIESDQTSVEISEVDLHHLAQQCINLLATEANNAGVTVRHLCDGHHAMVRADFLRLKQVLINLLSNAIKYNRKGGDVTVDCENTDHGTLRINIIDTGVGIDPARHDEVFEAFSRLDFKNSNIEGVGIGLLVTKKLVESMNGTIDFVSTQGKGTKFWVELPLGSDQKQKRTRQIHRQTTNNHSAKNILYVEDNPSNIKLIETFIKTSGSSQLLIAMTGQQGIEIAQTKQPDLILLDINLPDISGVEVAKILKENDQTRDIPIVALTADIARQRETLNKDQSFFKIIYKPVDLDELLSTIGEATS